MIIAKTPKYIHLAISSIGERKGKREGGTGTDCWLQRWGEKKRKVGGREGGRDDVNSELWRVEERSKQRRRRADKVYNGSGGDRCRLKRDGKEERREKGSAKEEGSEVKINDCDGLQRGEGWVLVGSGWFKPGFNGLR